jgi:hypothetical protein
MMKFILFGFVFILAITFVSADCAVGIYPCDTSLPNKISQPVVSSGNTTIINNYGGGNQTPWTSNIDANGYELLNVSFIGIGTSTITAPITIDTTFWNAVNNIRSRDPGGYEGFNLANQDNVLVSSFGHGNTAGYGYFANATYMGSRNLEPDIFLINGGIAMKIDTNSNMDMMAHDEYNLGTLNLSAKFIVTGITPTMGVFYYNGTFDPGTGVVPYWTDGTYYMWWNSGDWRLTDALNDGLPTPRCGGNGPTQYDPTGTWSFCEGFTGTAVVTAVGNQINANGCVLDYKGMLSCDGSGLTGNAPTFSVGLANFADNAYSSVVSDNAYSSVVSSDFQSWYNGGAATLPISLTSPIINNTYNDNAFNVGITIQNIAGGTQSLTGFGINDETGFRVGQLLWIPPYYVDGSVAQKLILSTSGDANDLMLWTGAGAGYGNIDLKVGYNSPSLRVDSITSNVLIKTTDDGSGTALQSLSIRTGSLVVGDAGNPAYYPQLVNGISTGQATTQTFTLDSNSGAFAYTSAPGASSNFIAYGNGIGGNYGGSGIPIAGLGIVDLEGTNGAILSNFGTPIYFAPDAQDQPYIMKLDPAGVGGTIACIGSGCVDDGSGNKLQVTGGTKTDNLTISGDILSTDGYLSINSNPGGFYGYNAINLNAENYADPYAATHVQLNIAAHPTEGGSFYAYDALIPGYAALRINGLPLTLNEYSTGNVLVGTGTDDSSGNKLQVTGGTETDTFKLTTGLPATGIFPGTPACFDSNNQICACGSCA